MTKQSEDFPLLLLRAREKAISYVRPVLAELDVTEQQWRVIRALAESASMNTQELADTTCILGPSLSRILARFDADGVIVRKANASDHRIMDIRLSAKGKRLHKKISSLLGRQYQQFAQDVGAKKVAKLNTLLKDFVES